jgi:hypothetical protein
VGQLKRQLVISRRRWWDNKTDLKECRLEGVGPTVLNCGVEDVAVTRAQWQVLINMVKYSDTSANE